MPDIPTTAEAGFPSMVGLSISENEAAEDLQKTEPNSAVAGSVMIQANATLLATFQRTAAKHCNLHHPLLRLSLRQDYLAGRGRAIP